MKLRLQFSQMDNGRLKNVAWYDESQFLLWHLNGRVRVRHKEHESMDCQKALWHFGRQYEVQLDTSILMVFEGFHFLRNVPLTG